MPNIEWRHFTKLAKFTMRAVGIFLYTRKPVGHFLRVSHSTVAFQHGYQMQRCRRQAPPPPPPRESASEFDKVQREVHIYY